MKLIKLSPIALATTMALGGLVAMPGTANAEMSASATVSNFYLWRGLDISAGAPQVAGSLDYSHESGAYAGIWASSEEGGTETDLYVGFAGEAGGFSYDLSIWEYLYPSDNSLTAPGDKYSDSDLSEFVLGLGYADVGLTVYFGNDKAGGDDYEYVTLDYTMDKFNILYGTWMFDTATGEDSSHLTVAYSATDNFTFTVTKGFQDDVNTLGYDEDFLFHVAYSLPIDMK
ncbi:MAG: histidine kinase [Gammaproteobacteria bacterium]|nr:histidine kinase [Gammaproteobacteria bacterium]